MTRLRVLQSNWPWAVAAAAILLLLLLRTVSIEWGEDPRPTGSAEDLEALADRDDVNVLFVVVDTLRADRLGAYGYERETSPWLDALAGRGLLFTSHLAQSSWTKCSMASLWTGLYPARTGITRADHGLPEEALMPAEILKQAGYRTVGIWRNGWVSPTFGFAQGFDVYDRPVSVPLPPQLRRANPTVKGGGSAMVAVRASAAFLRTAEDDRWFLYLHLMDVHEYIYDKETALFGTDYSDVYDNSIRYVDDTLARLYRVLFEAGQLERTIIVVTSDHGEAFRERGYEGHARKVYRESTETPWILSLPFAIDPGVAIRSRTYNVDVWPTVLDLLGLPAMGEVDGRSRRDEILAAMRSEPIPETASEPGFAHLDQTWGNAELRPMPTVAVVDGPYRYVLSHEPHGGTREELFDATTDPAELEDLSASEAGIAESLRERALAYLESEPVWTEEVPSLELDELELNHLRALGYSLP